MIKKRWQLGPPDTPSHRQPEVRRKKERGRGEEKGGSGIASPRVGLYLRADGSIDLSSQTEKRKRREKKEQLRTRFPPPPNPAVSAIRAEKEGEKSPYADERRFK